MDIKFMDIKFIDELGSGSYGTTYVIEINKKYYAYKIERVLSLDAYYKLKLNEFYLWMLIISK